MTVKFASQANLRRLRHDMRTYELRITARSAARSPDRASELWSEMTSGTRLDHPTDSRNQVGGFRRRILGFSVLTMSVLSVVVSSTTIYFLYRVELDQIRVSLRETVESQAHLIEAMARFELTNAQDFPEGPVAATLSQIVDAHNTYNGIGATWGDRRIHTRPARR